MGSKSKTVITMDADDADKLLREIQSGVISALLDWVTHDPECEGIDLRTHHLINRGVSIAVESFEGALRYDWGIKDRRQI